MAVPVDQPRLLPLLVEDVLLGDRSVVEVLHALDGLVPQQRAAEPEVLRPATDPPAAAGVSYRFNSIEPQHSVLLQAELVRARLEAEGVVRRSPGSTPSFLPIEMSHDQELLVLVPPRAGRLLPSC